MQNNIIFYLQFKKDLQFLYSTLSLSQALHQMKDHGFSAVPVVTPSGEYAGSISEGDFLWYILAHGTDCLNNEDIQVQDLVRPGFMPAINVNVPVSEILRGITGQNYLPVVDDRNIFIGIITRQRMLEELSQPAVKASIAPVLTRRPEIHKTKIPLYSLGGNDDLTDSLPEDFSA